MAAAARQVTLYTVEEGASVLPQNHVIVALKCDGERQCSGVKGGGAKGGR